MILKCAKEICTICICYLSFHVGQIQITQSMEKMLMELVRYDLPKYFMIVSFQAMLQLFNKTISTLVFICDGKSKP